MQLRLMLRRKPPQRQLDLARQVVQLRTVKRLSLDIRKASRILLEQLQLQAVKKD